MATTHPPERAQTPVSPPWRLQYGATVEATGVAFRVWAPDARFVSVVVEGVEEQPLVRDDDGVWAGFVAGIGAGARYRYRVNDDWNYPDPCSRYQPDGPHGHSEVVDPGAYRWRDAGWRGLRRDGLIIYECHVGTHTPEGTFDALAQEP